MADLMNTAHASGAGLYPLTGAIRQVYANDIIFEAMPILKFFQFVTVRTELGKNPGDNIQFLKFSNVTGGGQLTEGIRVTTDKMSSSTININVYEQGKALKFSEQLLITAFEDTMANASKLLGRHYAQYTDQYLRKILTNGAVNVTYGASSTTHASAVTSRVLTSSAHTFNTTVIKDAVEILATKNAPKFGGDAYVCIASPHQLRYLRDDTNWIASKNYGRQEDIYNGEVGRYEDVRFIETTMCAQGATSSETWSYDVNLDAAGASSADIYQAYFLAENAFGFAEGLPVEMRDNGVEDFGREHSLMWYSVYGGDMIDTNNCVIAETG